VTGEVLDCDSLTGLLADVLLDMLDSTLGRRLDGVVNKVGDENDDDDSKLDELVDSDELEGLETDSQLV